MPKLYETSIRAAIRQAVATGKSRKLFDTDGLFLLLRPKGKECSAWWRQKYMWAGKEQLLSLGVYDEIGLADARERGLEIRKLVAKGIDPSAARKTAKAELRDAKANTFKAVALEWHAKFKAQWSAGHASRNLQRIEDNLFPWIGGKAIREVTPDDIIGCLDRVAERGAVDTARRVLQLAKKIFKWAIARGLLAASPAAHIDAVDHLPAIKTQHRSAIKDPVQFGALLRAIDAYQGGFVVKCALQLVALTFVRPGELRKAQWSEFQLEGNEPMWRIPGARMKMGGADHLVPLSKQAVAVLLEIQPLTGADGKGYVFPGVRNASRPLSDNTLNAALRTMGFTHEQHSAHGFRSSASTMLNEMQWHKDAIELQLSHMPRDEVRAAYNAADHLPLRRKMMQAWADYLVRLKEGAVS